MKYRIADETGWVIVEVQFNNKLHDDLVEVYLQDFREILDAASVYSASIDLEESSNE